MCTDARTNFHGTFLTRRSLIRRTHGVYIIRDRRWRTRACVFLCTRRRRVVSFRYTRRRFSAIIRNNNNVTRETLSADTTNGVWTKSVSTYRPNVRGKRNETLGRTSGCYRRRGVSTRRAFYGTPKTIRKTTISK